jgi:hypothetical protein
MLAIPVLRRLRWEDYKSKASLCHVVRPCLERKESKKVKKEGRKE